jgi:two-component system chemotaxis response regulator CheB
VLLVLHLAPGRSSVLPQILARTTDLRVVQADDGDVPEERTVYVAPPDSHMLVGEDGLIHLDQSALVHHVRPSADALLLSMARANVGRQIAVVLSGYFGMPGAAILAGGVDRALPLRELAPAVIEWALTPA